MNDNINGFNKKQLIWILSIFVGISMFFMVGFVNDTQASIDDLSKDKITISEVKKDIESLSKNTEEIKKQSDKNQEKLDEMNGKLNILIDYIDKNGNNK